jgi:hypothetical protein
MAGLGPANHDFAAGNRQKMGCWIKPGHDTRSGDVAD